MKTHPIRFLAACYTAALLLLAITQAGCGASARDKALSKTLMGVNAARDGFIEWDKRKQLSIVERVTSVEDGKAKLADYREQREPVLRAFEVVYRSLAIAAVTKETPLDEVADRAEDLFKALAALRASLDGP